MMVMYTAWIVEVLDVDGAFLQGQFYNGEKLYIWIPSGFELWYDDDDVLLMTVPLYGTKKAAIVSTRLLLRK